MNLTNKMINTNYKTKNNTNNEKIKFSFFSLIVFIAGLPTLYTINLSGELYGTEAILPIVSILIFLTDKEKEILTENKLFIFLLFSFLLIIGYVVSDLVAKTSVSNYLRAWGRNLILISDTIFITIIFLKNKNLMWWFFLGISTGSILYLVETGVIFDNANWKLSYGVPILILSFCISTFFPKYFAILASLGLGIFSFFMDGRSFGATCLLTSGILWSLKNDNNNTNVKKLLKIGLALLVAAILIQKILSSTDEEYSKRRDVSSLGRSAALKIAVEAVLESPFIGYGSWGEGTKKFAIQHFKETAHETRKLGYATGGQGGAFLAHSQILQSWMEGGILAASFFIYYGIQILTSLKKLLNRGYDYITPFFYFILIMGFWNLIFSPYSGFHRLNIAMTIAIICAINNEKKNLKNI